MKIKACLSKETDNWQTPKQIYDCYVKRLKWYDPCPLDPTEDGLKTDWQTFNFVNPPYSKLLEWVEKAIEQRKKGKITLMLIPARTDTQAFKLLYENNAKFTFIIGRLKFSNKNYAPFPSMLVRLAPLSKYPYMEIEERNKLYERLDAIT